MVPSLFNVTNVTGANTAENGAEVLLAQSESDGVNRIFALHSPGTDFVPVFELLSTVHDTLPDDAMCVDEIPAQVFQLIQFRFARKPFEQYLGWARHRQQAWAPPSASSSRDRSSLWSSPSAAARSTTPLYRRPTDWHRNAAASLCSSCCVTTGKSHPKPGISLSTTRITRPSANRTSSATSLNRLCQTGRDL